MDDVVYAAAAIVVIFPPIAEAGTEYQAPELLELVERNNVYKLRSSREVKNLHLEAVNQVLNSKKWRQFIEKQLSAGIIGFVRRVGNIWKVFCIQNVTEVDSKEYSMSERCMYQNKKIFEVMDRIYNKFSINNDFVLLVDDPPPRHLLHQKSSTSVDNEETYGINSIDFDISTSPEREDHHQQQQGSDGLLLQQLVAARSNNVVATTLFPLPTPDNPPSSQNYSPDNDYVIVELKRQLRLSRIECTKLKRQKNELLSSLSSSSSSGGSIAKKSFDDQDDCRGEYYSSPLSGVKRNLSEEFGEDDKEEGCVDEELLFINKKSKKLLLLVDECSVLYASINGRKQLSPSTGLFLSDLNATCGVSVEKLPHVIGNVVNMLFGKINAEALNYLSPNSFASSVAIERFNYLYQEEAKKQMMDNQRSDSEEDIKCGTLIMDESNKSNSALKCKILICLHNNGKVTQRGLVLDTAYSKKTQLSAKATFKSLFAELGIVGCAKITSATCDWFADGKEAKTVMKYLDAAVQLDDSTKDRMVIRSKLADDLQFHLGGSVRQHRVRPCQAHNFERILQSLLDSAGQQAGLTKDATTLQSMFCIHYYLDTKVNSKYKVVLFDMYGKDFSKEFPRILWNKFGTTAANRWLSREKQAARLISMLQIPADDSMIELVRKVNINEFDRIIKESPSLFSTIFDGSKLSVFVLSVFYLLHKLKPNSDVRKGCYRILGFLCSYEHRAALCVMASMLSMHRQWLSFSNCKAEITSSAEIEANSTRVLESSVFSRKLLLQIYDLQQNWKETLPELVTQLESISRIEFHSKDVIDDDDRFNLFLDRWDKLIVSAVKPMKQQSLKYFRDIDLKIGWSLALLTNPVLAPSVSKGILLGLCQSGTIASIVESYGEDFPSSTPFITDEDFEMPSGNDGTIYSWSLDDPIYAYPDLSYGGLIVTVKNSYTNHGENGREIIKAYGLYHPNVVGELISLSKGMLKSVLLSNGVWTLGAKVSTYFDSHFKSNFPFLHECLMITYGAACVTSTAVEAAFAEANSVVHANNSPITNALKLNHILSIKNPIIHQQFSQQKQRKKQQCQTDTSIYDEENEDILIRQPTPAVTTVSSPNSPAVNSDSFGTDNSFNGRSKRIRSLRSVESRSLYYDNLWNKCNFNSNLNNKKPKQSIMNHRKIPSIQELRSFGKKKKGFIASLKHVRKDMKANANHRGSALNAHSIIDLVRKFNDAKREGATSLPLDHVDPLYPIAKKMKKEEILKILMSCKVKPIAELRKMRKIKAHENDLNPTLVDTIVEYWNSNGTTEADLL